MADDPEARLLTFRPFGAEDLDIVMANETRAYAFPWPRGIFEDCVKAGYICRLALAEGAAVGHGVLSVAAGEAHLLNVCVRRDHQGYGLGRQLVQHMLKAAYDAQAGVLFLEVRFSNVIASALYHSLGFNEIGVRKDYYPGALGKEDARVLALDLSSYFATHRNLAEQD